MRRGRWARQTETEIANGVFVDSRSAEGELFAKLIERYRVEILPSLAGHGIAVAHKNIAAFFKRESLAAVTPDRVMDYVKQRASDGVKLETVRKELQAIAAIFTASASLWRLPCVNPVPEVKARIRKMRLFAPVQKRERRLTAEEYEKIKGYREANSHIKTIALLAIETAMRAGEIANLKWQDVNLKKRLIKITESKTDYKTGEKGRTIPMTGEAVKLLESMPRQITGKVFGIRSDAITKAFIRMCKGLEIEGLRFHDLRREAISRFFERGLNITEVRCISGHKTLDQLSTYVAMKPLSIVEKLR